MKFCASDRLYQTRTGFRSRYPSGFTLVELLAVVSILGILAALIAASLISPKSRARQAQCLANLRQHGIALNTFLAEHNEYPLAQSANVREQYPDHHSHWQGALFPEMLDQRDAFRGEAKIFDCPSANRPKQFSETTGYSDYGYNAWGLGGLLLKPLLGLGGKGPGPTMVDEVMQGVYPPPVSGSDVIHPSEMVAIGDGFNGWNGVIRDGVWVLGRGPDAQEFFGSTSRSHARHKGKGNAAFCDGHIDSLSLGFLFQDRSDQALRLWNRDNQPHRERLGR